MTIIIILAHGVVHVKMNGLSQSVLLEEEDKREDNYNIIYSQKELNQCIRPKNNYVCSIFYQLLN